MAADIDLLPLPDKVEVDKHLPTGVRIYAYDATTLKNYARANVAHATAAKDAEIERLQAEVDRLQEVVRPKREDDCLTLDHWRMRAYDLEANWSRCSRACAGEQSKREQAEALVEELRVDVEAWKASHSLLTDTCHHFQARANRLAAALHTLAAHVRPTCSVLWDEAQAALAAQPGGSDNG